MSLCREYHLQYPIDCLFLTSHRPSNMTQLFAASQAERKLWRTLPNGGHNDTVAEPGYFDHIHSFITEEVLNA